MSSTLGQTARRVGDPVRRVGAAVRSPGVARAAGPALARLTVVPALLVAAWLVPGVLLLLGGVFSPAPELLIAVPLAVALTVSGLRVVPAAWPRGLPGRPGRRAPSPGECWFGLTATVALVVAFIAWQYAVRSTGVVVDRQPGAMLQTGYWIANHGSLPIPVSPAAFGSRAAAGGARSLLSFASTGFAASGHSVVPTGVSGLPLLLAGGFWTNSFGGAQAVGPVLGGLAVLCFGGLVARLVGPAWAPAGALVLGLSLPQVYVSRAAFAEPALQVLLFGGLCLVIDALALTRPARRDPAVAAAAADARDGQQAPGSARGAEPRAAQPDVIEGGRPHRFRAVRYPWGESRFDMLIDRVRSLASRLAQGVLTPRRRLALLGGVCLGLTVLVSATALVYLLPVVPFGVVALAARLRGASSFCIGLVIGIGLGLADLYLLSRPYADFLAPTLALIGVVALWLAAVTVAVIESRRVPVIRRAARTAESRGALRYLPEALGLLVPLALVALAIRPYLQRVHAHSAAAVLHYVGGLQRAQHLPLDPSRTYAEDTFYWVVWYVGLPALLLGGFGAALCVRACVRAAVRRHDPSGVWRAWALPLSVLCGGTAAVLWDPRTLPDQPWASRRLVAVVLPGLVLCGIWAAAWLSARAVDRGARPVTEGVICALSLLAMGLPTAATTFDVALTHSGPAGSLRLTADGMGLHGTGAGELAAVDSLCRYLPPRASVLFTSRVLADQFMPAVRGMCGVPAALAVGLPDTAVLRLMGSTLASGRNPVLLSRAPRALPVSQPAGLSRVLDVITARDPHTLVRPPGAPVSVRYVIWAFAAPSLNTRPG